MARRQSSDRWLSFQQNSQAARTGREHRRNDRGLLDHTERRERRSTVNGRFGLSWRNRLPLIKRNPHNPRLSFYNFPETPPNASCRRLAKMNFRPRDALALPRGDRFSHQSVSQNHRVALSCLRIAHAATDYSMLDNAKTISSPARNTRRLDSFSVPPANHNPMKTLSKGSLSLSLWLALAGFCLLASSVASAGQPIVPVAVTDQLPPGIGPNTGFGIFQQGTGAVVLNDAGQAAFIATLTGVGINSTNDLAMFSGAPGALQLVAREGPRRHPPPSQCS